MGIEKFRRKIVGLGGLGGVPEWRGVTTISSGDTSVTVSRAALTANSGFPIMHGLGATSVASHRDLVTSVDSIVDGTSFEVVVNNAVVDDQEVTYLIVGS